MSARPFIKWAGGKNALLPEILSRLPKKIDTYYEPFVGGGAVFFALAAEKRFKRAVLADCNVDLMTAYASVAKNYERVAQALEKHAKKHSEDHFYSVRALNPHRLDEFDRAARIIYLNKTCFNGLYRVNRFGEFNVPFGRYVNPKICDRENLQAVSNVFKENSVRLWRDDFEQATADAGRGDFVYFDPPYVPTSATSNFTGYSAGGFTAEDQVRLRDTTKALFARGVQVLLSNADVPAVRQLYKKGFRIEEVQAPRRVNSKGGKRGNVGELLITGRYAP